MEFSFLKIYKTTDFSLPWYDFSTLAALHKCPRKGVIQYSYNKHMPDRVPSQALSAGTAMHKFFAAWNGFNNPALLKSFDKQTVDNMYAAASLAMEPQQRLNFAMEVFNDYVERDLDKKRSLANLQRSARYWADMQTHNWTIIAVEQNFDITIEFDDFNIRYVGLIDAIAMTKNGTIFSVEYKTTSRITDVYHAQWLVSPQLTGYNLALKAIYGSDNVANYSVLEAITIPVPAKPGIAPIHMREQFKRAQPQFDIFEKWVYDGVLKHHNNYYQPWLASPQATACIDYNHVCQFMEFCCMEEEDREFVFNNEMVVQEWNPIGVERYGR